MIKFSAAPRSDEGVATELVKIDVFHAHVNFVHVLLRTSIHIHTSPLHYVCTSVVRHKALVKVTPSIVIFKSLCG